MQKVRHPTLYEINTRVWLQELSRVLGRRLVEAPNLAIQAFYQRLLECLKRAEVRDGRWRLLECRSAWDGNPTWKHFLAFRWQTDEASRASSRGHGLLVVVNYGPTQGQCYVVLPEPGFARKKIHLRDFMSSARYLREGDDLISRGLYLDMPEWAYHVFEVVDAENGREDAAHAREPTA